MCYIVISYRENISNMIRILIIHFDNTYESES